MSTPVRGADGPLGYAPRWARTGSGRADMAAESRGRSATPLQDLPQDLRPARLVMPPVPPREAAASREALSDREFGSRQDLLSTPQIAPQEPVFELGDEPFREPVSHWDETHPRVSRSGSFWKRKKRSAAFEGDTALKALRSHLAAAPDHTPEPPLYPTKTPIFAAVVRLTGVMVLAAAGALGFLWITAPHAVPPQAAGKLGGNDVALVSYPPVSYRGLEAPQNSPRMPGDVAAMRTEDAPPSATPWAVANYPHDAADVAPAAALAPRVVISPRASSRVAAPPAAAEPAPAATPPAPLPAEPALSAAAPAPAAAVAKAPVPVITAPVSVAPPAMAPTRDRDEIAALLVRARTYLSAGDVAAARLVLRRAAERDDPQAALALGGTYDPIVLKRLGIINFHADPAQAREWYRRAAELGSPDAALRLEQLVQTDH
jgi:hypothetical protein